ncbi:MAG: hypothetical protein J2P48_18285 [Alphaproteobacteria bacterium]|nr:hypothetical protein [Alphaproteobacteria bacterium]
MTIDEVVARAPDLIIGFGCAKKFRPERVMARPGFERTSFGHLAVHQPDVVRPHFGVRFLYGGIG